MEGQITINIQAPELTNALLQLASVLSMGIAAQAGLASLAQQTPEQREADALEGLGVQPDTAEKSTDRPQPANAKRAADIPSVVELRAKATEKGTTPEAKKAVKQLLTEFGSKSISEVPEDKRAEFLARLETL